MSHHWALVIFQQDKIVYANINRSGITFVYKTKIDSRIKYDSVYERIHPSYFLLILVNILIRRY